MKKVNIFLLLIILTPTIISAGGIALEQNLFVQTVNGVLFYPDSSDPLIEIAIIPYGTKITTVPTNETSSTSTVYIEWDGINGWVERSSLSEYKPIDISEIERLSFNQELFIGEWYFGSPFSNLENPIFIDHDFGLIPYVSFGNNNQYSAGGFEWDSSGTWSIEDTNLHLDISTGFIESFDQQLSYKVNFYQLNSGWIIMEKIFLLENEAPKYSYLIRPGNDVNSQALIN